jgi:hypothetical protein
VAWDNTAKNINVPGAGRYSVGVSTEAAGNGTTSIAVRLDGLGPVDLAADGRRSSPGADGFP